MTTSILPEYRYGWSDPTDDYRLVCPPGLTEEVVRTISAAKGEPDWMLNFRLGALRRFQAKPMLDWFAAHMPNLDFGTIHYYLRPTDGVVHDWEDVPEDMRRTYERLGIPESERAFFAGVSAQMDSEVVYHRQAAELDALGVIFCDMDTAVREHPEVVQEHFATVITPGDNKFAALNSAVWSGGSFIYVPPGVKVPMPLQAYFRINAERAGQFERTLIVADEGAEVSYHEGCSAPVYSRDALHSAVVEIVARPGARVTYQTIQNWSADVYNLVTKRARAEEGATVSWLDINAGSQLTMKYPCVVLAGAGAHGEVLSVAHAGPGQHQDTGAKMIHAAPNTTSLIESRSISLGGGRSSYRGLVRVEPDAPGCRSFVRCDALLLDEDSRSDTYPYIEIGDRTATVGHEATVTKVAAEQLYYLMSRGLSEAQATSMIVAGFVEPVARRLPLEYSVELTRLLEVSMHDAVG